MGDDMWYKDLSEPGEIVFSASLKKGNQQTMAHLIPWRISEIFKFLWMISVIQLPFQFVSNTMEKDFPRIHIWRLHEDSGLQTTLVMKVDSYFKITLVLKI